MDPTVDLGRFVPEQMVSEFSDACVAAKVGEIFTVNSQFGTHIVNLTYKTKPVRKAQIATVIYNVEPSATTQQTIYGEARAFLEKAGKNYESFNAAVAETGAARRVATINSTDRGINGLNEANAVTRWAFNGKEGEVSAILDVDGGDYFVGVIKEAREEGYAPIENVAERIAGQLRNQKKSEMIAAEFAGKDLASAVTVEGAKDGVAEDVSFGSFYIPSLGIEPKFVGAVCVSEAGVVSKPVVGGAAVYMFSVNSKEGRTLSEADEKVRLEAQATSYIAERLSQALNDETEVVDNRIKFF
jgi:peptidyl-prolyl cis-trans isomerase D